MSVNKVILIGRLGQDPELKYTPSGGPVCNFSMATSESWKDRNSGQRQERTEWHRVVVWNKLAEFANQYLAKGRQVYVEGRLQTRSWDDKDGNKRYTTEIVASTLQFISGDNRSDNSNSRGGDYSGAGGYNQNAGNGFGGQDMMPPAGPGPMDGGHQKMDVITETNFTTDDIPF